MQRFLSFLLQKGKLVVEGDPKCLNLDMICLLIHLMALLEHIHPPIMANINTLIRDIILLPLLVNLILHRVKEVQEENFIHPPIMDSILPLMLLVRIRTIEGITKGKDMPCLLGSVLE